MNGSATGCPVRHGSDTASTSSPFWSSLLGGRSTTTTMPNQPPSMTANGCPVKSTTGVASVEEAARYEQTPQPNQTMRLGTQRQVSSILRTAEDDAAAVGTEEAASSSSNTATASTIPHHQRTVPTPTSKWVYPSEQQLYNAMIRKGYSHVPVESIPTVLQIHNTVNERTWRQVQEWEGTDNLQLTKFQGRPKDISPKAFFLCHVLHLYDPPFDRHDWYVQPTTPTTSQLQRYVIDYYYVPTGDPNMPVIPYIDARPALDHPRAIYLRTKRLVEDAFPRITSRWRRQFGGDDDQ